MGDIAMTTAKPAMRPARPEFSSGPCAKRPGWAPENLSNAVLGRSHRSKLGKARLKEAIDRTRAVLEVPDEEAKHYAEGVRRGGTLLAVTAANYLADQAEDVLLLHGAVDLRQRTIRRQQQGWSEVFTISVEKRWAAIRSWMTSVSSS